jgi:tetratricopeptide (TPR) repeat protein
VDEADSLGRPRKANPSRRRWLLLGLSALTVIGLLCLMVLVPAGVRALPGRYAARLPEFMQELRHRPHPDLLPTPAVVVTPFPASTPTSPSLRGVTFITGTPLGEGLVQNSPTPQPKTTHTRTPQALLATASATPTPTASPTPTSSATPTSTPLPPTPTATQLAVRASLRPVTHTYQTWNNCGPATVTMALYYFGQSGTQAQAAAFLKPDPEDKNVSPHEMETYVRSLGLGANVRVGGDLERLKRLIAAGFPVIVETWFIPEPGDQMGHYRVLVGYDDEARQFIAQDSYNGPNVQLDYAAFDELWRVFNRVYIVIYDPSQTEEVAVLLGEDMDDRVMYERALERAEMEASDPSTECIAYENCADAAAFAWFNAGSNLTSLGRHREAAAAYDQARMLGLPWRMLWYQFGPYEAYYAAERFDDVITLATTTLNIVANLEESHFWRGMAYLAKGEADRARGDFHAALKYNPNFAAAQQVLESLE